jgi:hypothetical protein
VRQPGAQGWRAGAVMFDAMEQGLANRHALRVQGRALR